VLSSAQVTYDKKKYKVGQYYDRKYLDTCGNTNAILHGAK